MSSNKAVLVLAYASLALGAVQIAQAQTGDTSLFAPLTLGPAPSQIRLASGAPGPKYWQNRADYHLKSVLDTATKSISGSMTLRYTNNSPDTLRVLWLQTEMDPNERIDRFVQLVQGQFVPVKVEPQERTETKVTLAEPIKPGAVAMFQVTWQFVMIPRKGGGRMGRRDELYQIAQWYPRVNVYDDVKGWNTEPYSTGAEFYLEYGDYTMDVTVPAGYIVAATGTLANPKEVLTPTQIARLAVAAKADTVVRVVTAAELASGAARPTRDGMLTWTFNAKNVRDMVWSAAPDYQWDATSWKGILMQSYYQPQWRERTGELVIDSVWKDAADMVRMTIQDYSERLFHYPYPQASVVEGPITGQEYPMLAMSGGDTPEGLYRNVTHEVGHNWFPIIVGSNERTHTWQDEGFNTFYTTFSMARRYPEENQIARASYALASYGSSAGPALERGKIVGNEGDQYDKPVAVLQMLRRDILGPELFDKAMRVYVQRWLYKHPTPVDFFRTMNDVAGRNLDWYWRQWFLDSVPVRRAIDSVSQTTQGGETKVTVTYGNKERGVMPLLVQFTFSDGTTQDFTYPVEVWKTHGSSYTVSYTFTGKTVTKIALDPDGHMRVALTRIVVSPNMHPMDKRLMDESVWMAK